MNTPCPTPTGYVAQLCTNHDPFTPALAHTGVNMSWPFWLGVALVALGLLSVATSIIYTVIAGTVARRPRYRRNTSL